MTSCLKSGLEDLPEFEGNDITGVSRVEYRFNSSNTTPVNNENIVAFVTLNKAQTIDAVNKTVAITVTVPAATQTFPQAERDNVSLNNLVVILDISTAAIISPLDGSPKLGVPGNWSQPNRYEVKAANGSTAIWTVEITSLTK